MNEAQSIPMITVIELAKNHGYLTKDVHESHVYGTEHDFEWDELTGTVKLAYTNKQILKKHTQIIDRSRPGITNVPAATFYTELAPSGEPHGFHVEMATTPNKAHSWVKSRSHYTHGVETDPELRPHYPENFVAQFEENLQRAKSDAVTLKTAHEKDVSAYGEEMTAYDNKVKLFQQNLPLMTKVMNFFGLEDVQIPYEKPQHPVKPLVRELFY